MPDESPRKRSPVWAMLLTVAMAWLACAGYRWRMPPLVEARAIVQVPSATDLGTLCRRPEVLQDAVRKLEADSEEFLLLEQPVQNPQLSGTVTARKIANLDLQTASSNTDGVDAGTESQSVHVSTETWELSYRTHKSNRALAELSAIVAIVQQRMVAAADNSESSPSAADSASRTAQLETDCQAAEQALQELPPANPIILAEGTERTEKLELDHTDAVLEHERDVDDWDLVEQEFQVHGQLATALEVLAAGPVKVAVQQLEHQRKLSQELTRLNATERRLEEVYGDRHPKLIEVRKKFDQLLTELGGWSEVIDQQHLGERLRSLRESSLAEKQDLVEDLALRLELEQSELADADQMAQQRTQLTTELEALQGELTAARESQRTTTAGLIPAFTVTQPPRMADLPWFLNAGVLFGLATVCGLLAGRAIHRTWPVSDEPDDFEPEAPVVPTISIAPLETLDLAQRRALRQARLKQVYA